MVDNKDCFIVNCWHAHDGYGAIWYHFVVCLISRSENWQNLFCLPSKSSNWSWLMLPKGFYKCAFEVLCLKLLSSTLSYNEFSCCLRWSSVVDPFFGSTGISWSWCGFDFFPGVLASSASLHAKCCDSLIAYWFVCNLCCT